MKTEKGIVPAARAALYIRVSTEEQAVHGLSIEAQREALDAWAETAGVQVARHYIDAGISARKSAAKRPELQRLLADVEAGLIDLVVFTKLDRWFRNIAEYYKCESRVEQELGKSGSNAAKDMTKQARQGADQGGGLDVR